MRLALDLGQLLALFRGGVARAGLVGEDADESCRVAALGPSALLVPPHVLRRHHHGAQPEVLRLLVLQPHQRAGRGRRPERHCRRRWREGGESCHAASARNGAHRRTRARAARCSCERVARRTVLNRARARVRSALRRRRAHASRGECEDRGGASMRAAARRVRVSHQQLQLKRSARPLCAPCHTELRRNADTFRPRLPRRRAAAAARPPRRRARPWGAQLAVVAASRGARCAPVGQGPEAGGGSSAAAAPRVRARKTRRRCRRGSTEPARPARGAARSERRG